jgi:hypothetical protein
VVDGLAAFLWLFRDREGFSAFVIMECLLKSHAWKSHPPPQAHFPRIPGAFLADRIIVGRYPWYRMGKGPR